MTTGTADGTHTQNICQSVQKKRQEKRLAPRLMCKNFEISKNSIFCKPCKAL